MNKVSINNNPSNWNNEQLIGLRISSLNCRSLRSKIEDIRKDFELLMSDIICLSETWLNPEEQLADLQLKEYSLHVNSTGPGKGLATYYKNTKFSPEIDVNEKNCQLSKFTSKSVDVVSIYRSSDCKIKIEDIFKNIRLSNKKPTLIVGDINICYQEQRENVNIQYLEEKNFKQIVTGATHLQGGHIDHVYINDHQCEFKSVDVEMYSPYYTCRDHDGLLTTLVPSRKR